MTVRLRSWVTTGTGRTMSRNTGGQSDMNLSVESEQEEDGRWLAQVPQLPGVLAYGLSCEQALSRAQVLALRELAARLEHGERSAPGNIRFGP